MQQAGVQFCSLLIFKMILYFCTHSIFFSETTRAPRSGTALYFLPTAPKDFYDADDLHRRLSQPLELYQSQYEGWEILADLTLPPDSP